MCNIRTSPQISEGERKEEGKRGKEAKEVKREEGG